MKIVHLITTLGVGGAEKHLLWLGAGQRAAGHEVSVLYLKGEGELAEAYLEAGMQVEKIPFEGLGDLPGALSGIGRRGVVVLPSRASAPGSFVKLGAAASARTRRNDPK